MLEANIRHIAVVNGVGCASRGAYNHLLDLIRLKRMALAQIFKRVERCLDGSTGCPLLKGRDHYPIELAELRDHPCRICFRVVGLHEIVWSRQNIVDASPARVDHECSVDSVASS